MLDLSKIIIEGNEMWIYENNHDNSARFIIGAPGIKNLLCIGVNPSTEETNKLDSTILNVRDISRKKGFDGWIMINLYPQRATNPNELHNELDETLHHENLEFLKAYFKKNPPADVWASWGVSIEKRSYLKSCLYDINNVINTYTYNCVRLGILTQNGHPHHPTRIGHKNKFFEFDIDEYLRSLK